MYQGIKGYQWEYSYTIAAYSNLFVFFAIIFILIGEVFGAKEEVIRAYSNAFISNINTRGNITLSHEMGTPLMLVRELFQRLSRDLKRNIETESFTFSKEVSKEYLAEIKEIEGPLNTLARIANDLKKRAGIFKTKLISVSLRELIYEVKKTAELNTRGKLIEFKIIPDEKNDTVKIDPDQMNVILRNLLENAIDAVPNKNAIIEISWEIRANVTIIIKDNGIGIPKRELKNIEKPYYTTKQQSARTGLGLSIVKNFLQEIGGSLNIDSPPGQGTTVEIKFPNILK
jgi:signal transduction histidine kinase